MSSTSSKHGIIGTPPKEVCQQNLQNEPDVYFEITGPKYKESPSAVKEKGGLHTSRLPHIQKVQRMCPSTQAVYVKWDLDRVPHYQLARDRRKEVSDLLLDNSIPIETYDHTKSVIKENDIAIFNVHTPEFDRYAKEDYDRINFERILDRVLQSEASDVSERGNIALSVGFASLNQKHSPSKGVATPQVVLATDAFLVEQMCIMSDLIKSLSKAMPSQPPIFQDDQLRNVEFSGYLPSRYGLNTVHNHNIIEAATFAVTKVDVNNSEDSNLFGCHVDQFNDRLKNWNVVVCAYKYVMHAGQLYRVALIGYSRGAIRHHYIRLNAFEILRQNLRRYIWHLRGVRSGKYSAITCLSFGETIYSLPHLNICAFYSSYASCIRKLLLKYTKIRNLEKISELLLPMCWTTSPELIYECYSNWLSSGLPDENLTLSFISYCICNHGSILKGKGQRNPTNFDCSISMYHLVLSLRVLRSSLVLGRLPSSHFQDIFNALSGKDGPSIYGGGGSGLQLIIAVASLSGCLGHYRFLANACICDGTLTAKKLSRIYGLGITSSNMLLSTVASDCGVTVMTVENCLSTYMQECDTICGFDEEKYDRKVLDQFNSGSKSTHCDSFFSDQMVFYTNSTDGVISVDITTLSDDGTYEISLSNDHIELCESSICNTRNFPWWLEDWNAYDGNFEIKVTTTSVLRVNTKPRTKGSNRRAKVVPSGFAVIPRKVKPKPASGDVDNDSDNSDSSGNESDDECDEPYVYSLSRLQQHYTGLLSKRRLRSHSNRSFDAMVFSACREDKTYHTMQVYDDLLSFFGGSAQKKHSKNKKFLRYEKPPKVFEEELYTAVFDCCMTYRLLVCPGVPYYNHGLYRICNGVRYYKSGATARMAMIVELLVRIALGELKGKNDFAGWHKSLLPDTRMETNEDYCVIHSSQYAITKNLPVGILFFHGRKRMFAVPTGCFLDCWQFYDLDRNHTFDYFHRRNPIRANPVSLVDYKESTLVEDTKMKTIVETEKSKRETRQRSRRERRKKKRKLAKEMATGKCSL